MALHAAAAMTQPLDLDSCLKARSIEPVDFTRVLGVSMTTYRLWRRGERKPSTAHALAAEKKFGIPRHELRPDLWPPPAEARKRHAAACRVTTP